MNKVLQLTKKIPKGKVTTYKIIAEKLGTKAYRAVGTALKNNKSAWGRVGGKSCLRQHDLIPCHRVVNSNGNVGSYKGIKNNKEKIRLLRKEGIKIKKNKIIDFMAYRFFFFLTFLISFSRSSLSSSSL